MSRISSLSSLITVVAAPLVAWVFGFGAAAIVLAGIAAIVVFQHRANIARLSAGTEPRVGSKPAA